MFLKFVGGPEQWIPDWPASDHEEPDEDTAAAKVGSGLYVAGQAPTPEETSCDPSEYKLSPEDYAAQQAAAPKKQPKSKEV